MEGGIGEGEKEFSPSHVRRRKNEVSKCLRRKIVKEKVKEDGMNDVSLM